MKILRNTFILTFIVIGLVFARTGGKDIKREASTNLKVKNQHYWVKDHVDENKSQLDRKRSNKRRRKIRKPIKGLR